MARGDRDTMGLRAGVAAAVVTPPVGVPLIGYPMARTATHVADELHARALVLESEGEPLAIVTIDALAIEKDTVQAISDKAHRLTGIPEDRIIVAATHTHTGPPVVEIFGVRRDGLYCEWLVAQAAGAVSAAWTRREPARIGMARGRAEAICFNRRLLQHQGGLALPTHDNFDPHHVIGPEGPTDPVVGVMRVDSEAQSCPMAIWVNFASHTDTVTGDAISADFPGVISRVVEAIWGEGISVQFTQGASGNLVPADPMDGKELASRKVRRFHDARGREKMEKYGLTLAGEVIKTAAGVRTRATPGPICLASTTLDLEVRGVPSEEKEAALTVLSDPGASEWDLAFARDVLWVDGHAGERECLPLKAFCIGEHAFCTVPGELFVEHGLNIKERSPFASTQVVTLSGGYFGYLPTRRAFANGGYETRPARSSRLEAGAGGKVVEAISVLLEQLYDTAQAWQGRAASG